MAIYINVVQEFRKDIEARLTVNDVIDVLISEKLIDEKLYNEIWSYQNKISYLLDIVLKDGKRCAKFIDILGTVTRLKDVSDSIKSYIDKIRKMIVIGGFPEFSFNYVVRNSVANTIQNIALDLDPRQCSTLVVHGLPGFGKSSLVNQVLQTKRFLEVSGGTMFWINLGEYSDMTTVINPLWNLYLTAIKLTNQVALVHRPEDIGVLQNELRGLFLDEHLAKSYVILDDVKSADVLKVFSLRCRTIVTTQDKDIANPFGAIFVKVTTGFTKKESLELLRKSLETDNLCSKEAFASKIHELCDGCPMLLNIIGSILKDSREEALSTNIIWDSIISEIKQNHYLPHPITDNVILMICKFVSCLRPEVQTCFHSLAVFPKHVNIRPEILMKLWDKSEYAVRRIMVELENKSLIVSFYNRDLKSYIYSIHSLVRSYLVEKADVNILSYHKKLIAICDEVICNSSADDPIANYMFGYYGYHAKHAQLYEKFDKYFDLKFIENKIKRVGSADLLNDFNTYKDLITRKNQMLERKLEDYISFVNSYSTHLHISPETNIVQFAFFNENNCAYEDAKQIADDNPDQLYFKLDSYSGINKNFPSLKTKTKATSTCFLNSKEVLVGTRSGSIEIKSFDQYQHKVQHFDGHSEEVFRLVLSPDLKSFLSISRDRSVKMWRFAEELDPQSPKLKQSNWKNLISPDENVNPPKTFQLPNKDFINAAAFPYDNSCEIVTASETGKITRWNTKTPAIIKESAFGLSISHVSYTHDSQQILFACDGKIYNYLRENLVYKAQLEAHGQLVLLPDFSEIAVLNGKKFEVWDYNQKEKKFSMFLISDIQTAVVNGDYLLIATANKILFYNCKTQFVSDCKNDYGIPSSLFIMPNYIAFICLDNERVQRCELYLQQNEKPLVHDLALFSCHWKDSLPIYFIVNKDKRIDIFNGPSSILAGIEISDEIKCATFSRCGNYLVLGAQSGNLYCYNYKRKKLETIRFCNEPINIVKCIECKNDTFGMIVAASNCQLAVKFRDKVLKLETTIEISNVLHLRDLLICLDLNGNLALTQLLSNGFSKWMHSRYRQVIVAATSKEKNFLGIVQKQLDFYVLNVLQMDDPAQMQNVFERKLFDKPKCLCFSSTGKLVAVGCESGDIKVFDIDKKLDEVMVLHKKAVERLLFSPNFESILVSVGDQIACWNLEKFLKKSDTNASSNDGLSRQLIFTFDLWDDKKLHDTVPYLLTSTNIHGKQLKYISASKDFRSFLVIDIDGNIFKMDIINS